MAQDIIELLKVQLKKALINRKSSEYKKIFLKSFEKELFCNPLDRNFAVFAEIFISDQSVRSMKVILHKSPSRHWKQYIQRKLWCNENYEYVLTIEHTQYTIFEFQLSVIQISFFWLNCYWMTILQIYISLSKLCCERL